MVKIAWTLSPDRLELTIYKVDALTRKLSVVHPLRRSKPLTDAEALKYVEDNFPNDGAVKAAADTLGLLGKK